MYESYLASSDFLIFSNKMNRYDLNLSDIKDLDKKSTTL